MSISRRLEDSSELKRYLFEYRYQGAEWGIEIIAQSPDEAKERLKSLAWARYIGEIKAKFSIPATGLVNRLAAGVLAWFD